MRQIHQAVPDQLLGAIHYWNGDFLLWTENFILFMYLSAVLTYYYYTTQVEEKQRIFLRTLATIWISLDGHHEKAIVMKHADFGLYLIKLISYLLVIGMIMAVQSSLIPVYLDLIIPLDEPRPKIFLIKIYFITDPNKHYYPHYFACLALMTLADYIVLLGAIHYWNGDFLLWTENFILFMYLSAVLTYYYYTTQVEEKILETNDYFEKIRQGTFLLAVLAILFLINWPGQLLIDESEDLFLSTYMGEWYRLSGRSKALLIIMRYRCMRPCIFTAGTLCILNYKTYALANHENSVFLFDFSIFYETAPIIIAQ
ncbi:uncharacterized protein LOC106639213 [Copidosoma floridanum]|uniref:uncharacterized protein LOC106639213 n=1 Tax=Copidosoma floridanum TaxID=29053 RepID=UPI000C6FBCFA|nr:uncharacterized protein LOC106639213 [Copidosoma floridanum]